MSGGGDTEKPAPGKGVVETSTSRIWLGDDGILWAVMNKGPTHLTLEHAIENVAALEQAAQGSARPLLSDIRRAKSVSKEHRDYFAADNAARAVKAAALIVGSPITRALGNFFIEVTRPPAPSRLFSSEREARAWLLQFVE